MMLKSDGNTAPAVKASDVKVNQLALNVGHFFGVIKMLLVFNLKNANTMEIAMQ